jgi:hypothetical protein
MVLSAMYFMLSQLVCVVASGVFKVSGVADGSADAAVVPGWGVLVIAGVLVVSRVGEACGVLVAVGIARTVCVCNAKAVEAI